MRRLLFKTILFILVIGHSNAYSLNLDNETVAIIGQYIMSARDFYIAYDRTCLFYKNMYKSKFNNELEKQLNLKVKTLDSLIDNQIVLIAAERMGIKISEKEIQDNISREPAFMKNGRFDEQVYFNRLKLYRQTPERYKKIKREEMIISKVKDHITKNIRLSKAELKKANNNKNMEQVMLLDKKEQSIKEFIENYKTKNKLNVTINRELIDNVKCF